MTVLVTGGAGYIGSHTVRQLLATGRRVVVLDSLEYGNRAAVLGAVLVVGDIAHGPLVVGGLHPPRAPDARSPLAGSGPRSRPGPGNAP